jgi:hypothetical protein
MMRGEIWGIDQLAGTYRGVVCKQQIPHGLLLCTIHNRVKTEGPLEDASLVRWRGSPNREYD